MRRALCLFAFALTAASAFVACSDDLKKPPYAVDPTVQPSNPVSGGGAEGGARDSGTPSQDAPTTCNDLPLTSIQVAETGVVGDPPAGTGGQLQDGIYDIIEAQKFVGTGTPGPTGITYKASIQI